MIVLKKEYGEDLMRRFLEYKLNYYLIGRAK